MTRTTNFLHNLRTVFELRKTVPTRHRKVVARVFEKCGAHGLTDASGTLWPVRFARDTAPSSGTVILCEMSARCADGGSAQKYEDDGFLLTVEEILDKTPSLTDWPNAVIPSPVAFEKCLLEASPAGHTKYFSSHASSRSRRIQARNEGLSKVRRFFENRGFTNMETPTIVPSGGVEAYVSSFHSKYRDVRGKEWNVCLPTSPEFALKKLLAEGFEKIFQLSRAYRNGGELARWHEPEFIMLEWYRSGGTLLDMMNDTRELVLTLNAGFSTNVKIPDEWKTHTVRDLFLENCGGIDLSLLGSDKEFAAAGQNISASVNANDDWDSVFCKLFMEKIEPVLAKEEACFVTHYPRRMGALARVAKDSLYVERFEAYLHGVEICNGYYELTDTHELAARFNAIAKNRTAGEVTRDTLFEDTMKFGLPPCSGNALGVDRVIAILSGQKNIASMMPIPFLSQFPQNTVAPE
jgi:lysyl-tRNA synthetase class 2